MEWNDGIICSTWYSIAMSRCLNVAQYLDFPYTSWKNTPCVTSIFFLVHCVPNNFLPRRHSQNQTQKKKKKWAQKKSRAKFLTHLRSRRRFCIVLVFVFNVRYIDITILNFVIRYLVLWKKWFLLFFFLNLTWFLNNNFFFVLVLRNTRTSTCTFKNTDAPNEHFFLNIFFELIWINLHDFHLLLL